jgi:hypothetical protein
MHATKKRSILSFITSDTRACLLVPTQSHIIEFRFASRRSILMLSAHLWLAVTNNLFLPNFQTKILCSFPLLCHPPSPAQNLPNNTRRRPRLKLLLTDLSCDTRLYSSNEVYINSPLLGCEPRWYSQWSSNCTS